MLCLCILIYIAGCCLIPPLLKIKTAENVELSQEISAAGRICVIDDNTEALLWRLRMIQEAKREIILVTFELRDDTSGCAVMASLLEAADRGVKVWVLVDGIEGELRLHGSRKFEAFLSHENIEVKYYNPLRITVLWKVNYRLHDKYLIIDDTTYLLGGRNTHDVYLGEFSGSAQEDRDVVVYETQDDGYTSIDALRDYFEDTWSLDDCVLLSGSLDDQEQKEIRNALAEGLAGLTCQPEYEITPVDWYSETIAADSITLLAGEPEAWNKAPVLWEKLCRLMETADQNVIIETPLIICDSQMRSDLAKISSGPAFMQIITNGPEINVNLLAADYSYQRDKMLEIGIPVSEYCGDRCIHTKTILIDDNLSVIGSFNLDARSAYIDTELMLVIDSRELNGILRGEIEEMQQQSRQMMPDGLVTFGSDYEVAEIPFKRKCFYTVFRIPFRVFQYLI